MALQVWLPLNGDLKNKGCADVTVVNNGATVDNNGKIGKCYYFNGSGYMTLPSFSTTKSICFWLKSSKTNNKIAFVDYKSKLGFGFYSNYIIVTCAGYTKPCYNTNNFIENTWNHITLVKIEDDVLLYINGVLQTSRTTSNQWSNSVDGCYIGKRSTGYPITGYINDFRVYDHALSPKEVKEIAQGLILHYKLDKFNINLVTDAEKRMTPNGQKSSNEYMGICNTLSIFDKYGLIPYTISFDIKAEVEHSFRIYEDSGANPKYTFTSKSINVTTEWQRIEYSFIPRISTESGTWARISVYGVYGSGAIVSVRNVKLEFGNKATPICENENVIIDSSGYGNHGTSTGDLIILNDTPRYNNSTKFPDNACSIGIGNLTTLVPTGEFTFNIWFKKITGEWSSKTWETILGGPSGFELEGKLSSTQNAYIHPYSWGGGSTTTPNTYSIAYDLDVWNMLTMVRTSSDTKFYLNGELKVTGSKGSFPSGDYFIGAWKTATQQNYRGYFSDARIYSTVLSADDILQLYQVSAKIDNLGNIHEYELIEETNSQPKVLKTGEIKSNKFVELYNFLYLPAGSFVASGLTYANNDVCKAETVIRYASGGSGRDLMGYSPSGQGYWGVTASGAWERHGTFSYTNTDITLPNLVSYEFSASNENGEYQIGALRGSYTVRNKYIYNVKLYKNGILERDLYPAKSGSSIGLFDIKNGQFHAANNSNATLGQDDETYIAKFYPEHIKGTQFIEI